ncbi:hypothetical protein MOE77_16690 [Bacillus inaquosorum]|uniref:hypothetical protein n=1 Tax=Bacillus inaquosorum TaxID=483913 RepID=UPI0022815D8F|nr:hypothetical protein [Bacillus inaquosorum]MCY9038552.1 hypothetical protein [Bacillus inaquosorum]MCY9043800.1 hypothetical protein [Bacillus inaquosorum]
MREKEQSTLNMCVVDEYIGSEVPPYLRKERQRWIEGLAWSCVGLSCIAKGISKDEALYYIEKAGEEMGLVDAATSLKTLLHQPYFEGCRSIADFIAKINRDMDGMESEEKFRFLYENVGTMAVRFVWVLIKPEEMSAE